MTRPGDILQTHFVHRGLPRRSIDLKLARFLQKKRYWTPPQ